MNQRCLYRQTEPPDEGGSVVFSDALLLLRSFNLDLLSEDTGLHVRSDAYSVDGAGLCYLQRILVEGRCFGGLATVKRVVDGAVAYGLERYLYHALFVVLDKF